MRWFEKKARDLQREVIFDEGKSHTELGEENTQRATIHARQDIVLMVSLLASLNEQISFVRAVLVAILLVLVFIAAKPYF